MKKSALILAVLAAAACKGQNLAEVPSDSLRIRTIGHHIETTGQLREDVTYLVALLAGFGGFHAARKDRLDQTIGWTMIGLAAGGTITFQFVLSGRERRLGRALLHR